MNDVRAQVGAGYAFVVLLMAVGSISAPRQEPLPEPDFSLAPWRPDLDALGPVWERDAALAAAHPLTGAADEAVGAFERLGRVEAESGGRLSNERYASATQDAVKAMSAYWFEVGEAGYRALGVHLGRRFERAIEAVLQAAREAGRPVVPWIRDHPEDPRVRELRAVAGNFVENAVGWGVITHDNRIAGDHPALLRLHFKLRWLRFVTEIQDYTFLMDKEELRALWLWRLIGDRNLPMDQRLRVGRWLRELQPDYPIYEVLGTLSARRGQNDEAIAYYREALLDDPFDEQIAANLEFLLRTR